MTSNEEYASPPRNGAATTALVLGILSVPGAFIPYAGAAAAIVAIVFGVVGVRQARAGRSTRRNFATAGLIMGGIGLVLSVVLFAYTLRRFQACEHKLGHRPNTAEFQQCVKDHV